MTSQTKTSTTFVQADTASFRHLVQHLTGLSGSPTRSPPASPHHPKLSPRAGPNHRRPSPSKLQDRRHALRKNLEVKLGLSALNLQHNYSLRKATRNVASPGMSPITPLGSESAAFWGSNNMESPMATSEEEEEEEKAIAQKRFYLHPSPASTPRGAEPPELLPLFPVSVPE